MYISFSSSEFLKVTGVVHFLDKTYCWRVNSSFCRLLYSRTTLSNLACSSFRTFLSISTVACWLLLLGYFLYRISLRRACNSALYSIYKSVRFLFSSSSAFKLPSPFKSCSSICYFFPVSWWFFNYYIFSSFSLMLCLS